MAQFARPASDITREGWFPSIEPNLWDELDETTPDDDFTEISYVAIGDSSTFEIKLSAVADPLSSTGHILRIRRRDNSGVSNLFSAALLLQGTTTIKNLGVFGTGNDLWATETFTLSAGEADSITDYSDLRVRVTYGNDLDDGTAIVTWAEFEVPNAPGGAGVALRAQALL